MGRDARIAVVGDVHGHLQLACCILARWQKERGKRFDAVFLCGDVGTFTHESQLDSATRAHFKKNPCELEFLYQWSTAPQAPWLDSIFMSEEQGGLGLECPVIMVHGNHEGFDLLQSLMPPAMPADPVAPDALPPVDTNGHVRFLPPGWRVVLPSGHVVAGIGGIQPGQRRTEYHPMAYIHKEAVQRLLASKMVDVLITHQGPSGVQGEKGSSILQRLLDRAIARSWFHGHSMAVPDITLAGRGRCCQVVPLGDIAFHVPTAAASHDYPYEVGTDGWALVTLAEDEISIEKKPPPFFREFRRTKWATKDGQLVCPPLAHIAWQT